MDKEPQPYEMYEYLSVPPNTTTVSEPDQFFVVQDDGSLFINKQVRYITHTVQDSQENLDNSQPGTVYDITPEQVFVGVDNATVDVTNATELISVSDGTSNLYANSYLLQSLPNSNTDQLENNTGQQFTEVNAKNDGDEIDDNKQITNCTEITLNEEQCNMLEHKGWVLLEINDKLFILDTVGLHDITSNKDLIQQLKAESLSVEKNIVNSESSENDMSDDIKTGIPDTSDCVNEPDPTEFINVVKETTPNTKSNDLQMCPSSDAILAEKNLQSITNSSDDNIVNNNTKGARGHDVCQQNLPAPIKLKTTFCLKDIPDTIVLGKTATGKNIVAKIKCQKKKNLKHLHPSVLSRIPKNRKHVQTKWMNKKSFLLADKEKIQLCTVDTADQSQEAHSQVEDLVRRALAASTTTVNCEATNALVDTVQQLLQLPAFATAVANWNLIVTKESSNLDKSNTMVPSPVTGRVISVDHKKQFVHVPDLLNTIIERSSNDESRGSKSAFYDLLHVQITETDETVNGIEGLSVKFSKRCLSLRPFQKVPKREKVVACGSCANVFASEESLLEHQEHDCIEPEDKLTIDTNKGEPFFMILTESGSHVYVCVQCEMKFNKLNNCQRHVKTHLSLVKRELSNDDEADPEPAYRCKMCPSSYFHPSSLSKHIVQSHINVNSTTCL